MPCLGYLTSVPDKMMRQWSDLSPQELTEQIFNPDWYQRFYTKGIPDESRYELGLLWEDLDRVFGGSFMIAPTSNHSVDNYPFSHIIFGGRSLGSENHIYILKTPEEVGAVSHALHSLTKEQFIEKYYEPHQFELYDDDEDLLWDVICEMLPFWEYAAEHGNWVLFDAIQ